MTKIYMDNGTVITVDAKHYVMMDDGKTLLKRGIDPNYRNAAIVPNSAVIIFGDI